MLGALQRLLLLLKDAAVVQLDHVDHIDHIDQNKLDVCSLGMY